METSRTKWGDAARGQAVLQGFAGAALNRFFTAGGAVWREGGGQAVGMDLAERLFLEKRARLAAERLLEQKSRELFAANERLAMQARALTEEVREQRQAASRTRSEADALKGQNARFLSDLDRAHTAAVMAERRLRDSIDAIRDGFAVFDAEGRLVTANRAFAAAFGGAVLAPGIRYEDLLARAAPLVDTGSEPPDRWTARMAARIESDPIPDETVALRDGPWLRLTDRRARDGDLVTLAVDITGEMRLLAALDALPDGFVLFDRDDRPVHCNARYRDLYPLSAAVMLPGARFEDILRHGLSHGQHSDAAGREEAWLAERLAAHRDGGATEQPMADGRWLRAEDKPTPDGGRVGLRRDITAERAAQAALETARAGAEAASRAKSAFLANMSHEIRTPMNGVVGMAELLCETGLTDEQRLFAETIKSSGEALLVIINDILDYSKLEADRMDLRPEAFDLDRMIHDIALLLLPQASAKGIAVTSDYDMFLPTAFVGDPVRLRQILTNLVGNAVKFTDSGHVLVRVAGFEVAPGEWQLHLSVEDTGIGIAPDQIDHIFGDFNQADSAASRRHEGTGLGLAISRRLVERMGGAIWADSTPGIGSVFGFRLTLPAAARPEAAVLPVTLRRVLVVDADHASRSILDRQLSARGLSVTATRSLTEGLALAGGGFDLVIADHDADPAGAAGIAAQAREAGHSGPILLLAPDAAAAGAAAGASVAGVMQKPVTRTDLFRHLSALATLPPDLPAATGSAARPMRVLVAEDNRTNQLVFAKMVKDTGIDLHFAANGQEAVALWASLRPDLIFMDISMPEMDGREAARAIRAAEGGEGVPILALTAHVMAEDSAAIHAAGIDRHLTKPLRRSDILSVLEEFRPPQARAIRSDPAVAA